MNENEIENRKIKYKYKVIKGESERRSKLLTTISEKTRVMEN